MDKFYSNPYFEILLKQATPEIKDWFQREIEYMKKNIKPNSKILDVGCDFGRHMKILAEFSKEVVGIDNNKDMIQKAKQNLSGLNNVRLFLQDARKLEFEDNYFDYVICMDNTFGQISNKLKALKEMKRVAKKGGNVVISVCSEKALQYRIEDCKKVGLTITKIEAGKIYTKEGLISEQFTKLQLKNLFDYVGLKVKIIELNPISYLCEAIK
jgi:2-polyprenyl-6-hydroxyphenyl methylase/3-demethylubiquinone-9 3-methyltransferase